MGSGGSIGSGSGGSMGSGSGTGTGCRGLGFRQSGEAGPARMLPVELGAIVAGMGAGLLAARRCALRVLPCPRAPARCGCMCLCFYLCARVRARACVVLRAPVGVRHVLSYSPSAAEPPHRRVLHVQHGRERRAVLPRGRARHSARCAPAAAAARGAPARTSTAACAACLGRAHLWPAPWVQRPAPRSRRLCSRPTRVRPPCSSFP